MKILMTGATGYIGNSLLKKISSIHELTILVRFDSDITALDLHQVKVIEIDQDGSFGDQILKENFDGVIHLASLFLSGHKASDIGNLIQSNIEYGTKLLEACKGVNWFINVGTFWQHFEQREYNPVNLYAATKEAFEKIALYYTETTKLKFVTLKLSDTYGKNDTRRKILNILNEHSYSGQTLNMSPGEQLLSLSHIDDVVSSFERLVSLLEKSSSDVKNNDVFNVQAIKVYSLKQITAIFEEACERKLNINWGGQPYRDREVMIPWEADLPVPGWKARWKLEDGIRSVFGDDDAIYNCNTDI